MATEIQFEPALNARKAAAFLGVTVGTLAVWRARRQGPPAWFSGRRVVYYASQLRAWQIECAERRREVRASASQAEALSQQPAENTAVSGEGANFGGHS